MFLTDTADTAGCRLNVVHPKFWWEWGLGRKVQISDPYEHCTY